MHSIANGMETVTPVPLYQQSTTLGMAHFRPTLKLSYHQTIFCIACSITAKTILQSPDFTYGNLQGKM